MFNKHSTLADVMIALEENYSAQNEAIIQAELVLKEMRAAAKDTYSKILMMDQLMGKGDYIDAYPKPKVKAKYLGVGHDPSGEQY